MSEPISKNVGLSIEALTEESDRKLAAQARAKLLENNSPSQVESAALRRVEAAEEEVRRWLFYRTIPAKHWKTMSGRQSTVLKEQQDRYGLPFGGAVIDLTVLAEKFHDFLADNAKIFASKSGKNEVGETASAFDEKTLLDLQSGDPLIVSKATARMAATRLADAARQGRLTQGDFENMKSTLMELRLAEEGYLELRAKKRELLERSEVEFIITAIMGDVVRCLETMKYAISTEFSIWLADKEIASMPSSERTIKIMKFFDDKSNEVRNQTADSLIAKSEEANKEEEANGV